MASNDALPISLEAMRGRRHAHCVWSRIDAQTMTAVPLPFFKRKLMDVSRDLYLDHGWTMPRGFTDAARRDPASFTLAEWQQAKRQGLDPRWTKQLLQQCWSASDNAAAFKRSLGEHGFFLAKGDRRGLVVLDHGGEVHSLPRMLGLKTKDVRARLGDGEALADVAATRAQIGRRMVPAIRRHVEESRTRFQKHSATLGHAKMEMTQSHRHARTRLDERQSVEWQAQTRVRQARVPKGLSGLWSRITGRYQEVRAQNEREASQSREWQAAERQKLVEAQLAERAVLQTEFRKLRKAQAERLLDLRREVGRFLSFARAHDLQSDRARSTGLGPGLGLGLER